MRAVQPNIKANPNWIPRTASIGTLLTIALSFFENPKVAHIIPVPNPVEITMLGVQLSAIATVLIVFWGCTGKGKLYLIPKTIFVMPKQKKIPAGFNPTIEI